MQHFAGQRTDDPSEPSENRGLDPVHTESAGVCQEAFEQFASFESQVLGYLLRKVETDMARDLLSDIQLKFVTRRSSLKDPTQVKEFIFQIARDTLRKYWLNQRRVVVMDCTPTQSTGTNPEVQLLERERLALLMTCLQHIPDETCRQVARLRFMMGLPQAKISEQLGLSIDRVKKYTAKAKLLVTKCVRQKLGRGVHGTNRH